MSTSSNTSNYQGSSVYIPLTAPPSFLAQRGKAEKAPKATPSRFLEDRDGWQFYRDDGLDFMVVLVNQQARQVWMALETYEVLIADFEANRDFTRDLDGWGSGMRYLVSDAGKYAEAAKKSVAAPPPAKDPLTTLEDDARAILIQVASFQGEPTEAQVRLFAERLADARLRAEALREQLERIESSIELAGVAIMDVTE